MSELRNTVKRTLVGRVVSDKMAKTVTVLVERRVRHNLYGKIITLSKRYHAHVDGLVALEGETVVIEECRPISRTKAWKVASVVAKNAQ